MTSSSYLIFRLYIISVFICTPYFYNTLDIHYVSEGGWFIEKINVYTYLFFIVSVKLLLIDGVQNPFQVGDGGIAWFNKPVAIFLLILLILPLFHKLAVSYFIDTLLIALLSIHLAKLLNKEQKIKTLEFISWMLLLNSAVAVLCFVFKENLFESDKVEYFSYFRSTGLFSHPLNNALITSSLVFILARFSRLNSVVYYSIHMAALFSFGGRTAILVFLFCFIFLILYRVRRIISRRDNVNLLTIPLGLFFLLIFTVIIIYLFASVGIAERIINKDVFDGSSMARIYLIDLMRAMSLSEWFFGSGDYLKSSIHSILGVEIIENYIVAFIFDFGIFVTIGLVYIIFFPLYKFFKFGCLNIKLSVVSFVVVSMSNNSMATKTPALLLCLLIFSCCFNTLESKDESMSHN